MAGRRLHNRPYGVRSFVISKIDAHLGILVTTIENAWCDPRGMISSFEEPLYVVRCTGTTREHVDRSEILLLRPRMAGQFMTSLVYTAMRMNHADELLKEFSTTLRTCTGGKANAFAYDPRKLLEN